MVSVLASSVVDRGFKAWLGQTKDNKIGSCCFSAKHASLMRKNKDWLAWNQDTVDCFFSELALKIQLAVLVLYKADFITISSNVTDSRHNIAKKLLI